MFINRGVDIVDIMSIIVFILFAIYMYIYLKSKKDKKLKEKETNNEIKIAKQKNELIFLKDKYYPQNNIEPYTTLIPFINSQDIVKHHTTIIPMNNNNNTQDTHTTVIPINTNNNIQDTYIIHMNNNNNTVENEYDTAVAIKINNENIFNAECVDNNQNYIIHPLPSYEVLAKELEYELIQYAVNVETEVINPVEPANNSYLDNNNTNQNIIFEKL